jgi:hypothetical protein
LGQKLRDQLKLTQELDSHLLNKMNEKLNAKSNGDKSVLSPKTCSTKSLPESLKSLLDNVDNESISLLSLSEILKLKTHLNTHHKGRNNNNNSHSSKNSNKNLLDASFENEKNNLINEAHQLRDLLGKLGQSENVEEEDWRAMIVKAVANIFQNQNENCLAELRSYIINSAYLDQEKQLTHIASKIDNQNKFHQESLSYLNSMDRQSLLDEIKSFKEETAKLNEEIGVFQQNERQFKREFKLMEYAKDAEAIKGNDLKQSLNIEKTKCLELMDKLNQEKKKTNSMQEQLCDLNEEFVKIKENLLAETENFKSVW